MTTPDIRIRPPESVSANEIIARIAADFPPERVSLLDGVKVEFPDGWALARASVTEPVITLRFEGRTREAVDRIMDDFLRSAPELRKATRSQ